MTKCLFLESFNHCPKCGGEFLDNNIKSKRCAACGFVYYFNPSAAVAAIVRNSAGEILVATRANEPAKGCFDLPGGFVDSYESAEQSVAREVAEECNIEIKEASYLFSIPNIYSYSNFDVHTLDIFFECQIDSFDSLKAADDVASLQFIDPSQIKVEDFGFPSVREGIRRYLEMLATR